jgi:tetratricopeptide (TPR) repeat protein
MPFSFRYFIYCFLSVLLLYPFKSVAQDEKVADSVKEEIADLLKHAKSFYINEPDSVIYYSEKALKLSLRHNYLLGQAESYNARGVGLRDNGQIPEALESYRLGIAIAKKYQFTQVHSGLLLNKGNCDESLGNYVEALEDFLGSIRLKEQLKDSLGIAKCLNNIAQVYSRQSKNEQALIYFRKSLAMKIALGDSGSIAKTFNNMGVIFNGLNQYDSALKYMNLARDFYTLKGSEGDVARSLGNIGWTYDLMGAKDTALSYYLQSLSILRDRGDVYDITVTKINIGSLYLETGRLNEAEKFLNEGLKDGLEMESKEDIKEAYKYLALLYEKQGRFKEAFRVQQLYQSVSDSILNEEKAAVLAELMVKYESSKKDEANKLLMKENEIQSILLERNRYINIGLGILLVLLAVVAWLVVKQSRLKARQEAMLIEQRLFRSQMNPHFIFNSLQSIQGYIFEKNPLEAGKYLSDFSRLVRMILEDSSSDTITLTRELESLRYYLSLQQLRFADKFDFRIITDPNLATEEILVPPMLIQPFVENAIEHGLRFRETKGLLELSITNDTEFLHIQISDNGVGRKLASEQHSKQGHKSMATGITNERIEIINKRSKKKAKLTIIDLENHAGTIVNLQLPLIYSV